MANYMENSQISLITPEERTSDGNLKPEVRMRVLEELKSYLRQTGVLNVSELSSKLGLSWSTTKKIVDEIMVAWNNELRNQYITQIQWLKSVVEDIEINPKKYNVDTVRLIKLKASLMNNINSLRKVLIVKK